MTEACILIFDSVVSMPRLPPFHTCNVYFVINCILPAMIQDLEVKLRVNTLAA